MSKLRSWMKVLELMTKGNNFFHHSCNIALLNSIFWPWTLLGILNTQAWKETFCALCQYCVQGGQSIWWGLPSHLPSLKHPYPHRSTKTLKFVMHLSISAVTPYTTPHFKNALKWCISSLFLLLCEIQWSIEYRELQGQPPKYISKEVSGKISFRLVFFIFSSEYRNKKYY